MSDGDAIEVRQLRAGDVIKAGDDTRRVHRIEHLADGGRRFVDADGERIGDYASSDTVHRTARRESMCNRLYGDVDP